MQFAPAYLSISPKNRRPSHWPICQSLKKVGAFKAFAPMPGKKTQPWIPGMYVEGGPQRPSGARWRSAVCPHSGSRVGHQVGHSRAWHQLGPQEVVPCYCWQGSAPTAMCMGAGDPPDIRAAGYTRRGKGRRGYVRQCGLSRLLERPSPHNLRSAKISNS